MPTRPEGPCTAQQAVNGTGGYAHLTCDGQTGHAGPHQDPITGVWWSDKDWLEQLNQWRGPFPSEPAQLNPDIAAIGTDPRIVPWESITIDGLTIPAAMLLADGTDVDVQHGRVSLRFRVREGVSVTLDTSGKRAEPMPDPDDLADTIRGVLEGMSFVTGPDGRWRIVDRHITDDGNVQAPRPGVAE